MSALQAFYAGAFSAGAGTPTLAQVLSTPAGNVASTDINMSQNDLVNVASVQNATEPLIISAPEGISLSGSVGTAGQVLSSNATGQPTWVSVGGVTTPTLAEVTGAGASAVSARNIDMAQFSITGVRKIENTTGDGILQLRTPNGLSFADEISGVGTLGQVVASGGVGTPCFWSDTPMPTVRYVIPTGTFNSDAGSPSYTTIATFTELPVGTYILSCGLEMGVGSTNKIILPADIFVTPVLNEIQDAPAFADVLISSIIDPSVTSNWSYATQTVSLIFNNPTIQTVYFQCKALLDIAGSGNLTVKTRGGSLLKLAKTIS